MHLAPRAARRTARRTAVLCAFVLAGGLAVVGPAAPPSTAGAGTFSSGGLITVPAGAPGTTSGEAAPYPSQIVVSGLVGLVTDINVKLDNLGHDNPDDLDILLVSPRGDGVVLMSDACGTPDVEDVDLTFDDEAAGALSDGGGCSAGTYKPSVYDGASDTWPAEFPSGHGSTLSDFDGENPLGAWRLYVHDDAGGSVGDIETGWSLSVSTGPADTAIPAAGAIGTAGPYPRIMNVPVSDRLVVTDLDVELKGVTHQHPDDLDMLLVGPQGQSVVLVSDACGSYDVTDFSWRIDDEAGSMLPDAGSTNVCFDTSYQPTDYNAEVFPAPAPPGPYGSTLSVFDQTVSAGDWKLFIVDDGAGDAGFLLQPPELLITGRPPATAGFASGSLSGAEGTSVQLTVRRSPASTALVPATVHLFTTPGSATTADFTPLDTVVSLGAGEATKVVTIPLTGDQLVEGAEAFTVTMDSATGDAAVTSASATVTIAPAALDTTLLKGPKRKTTKSKATVKFAATVPGATFECKIDKLKWKPCTSPLKLKNLKPGKHKVLVRATSGGVTEPTPLKIRWRVVQPG